MACSEPICTSDIQTSPTQCSPENNQCIYNVQYKDGSGTLGFYVTDKLYFDTILGQSWIANSSAPIVFGWVIFRLLIVTCAYENVKPLLG